MKNCGFATKEEAIANVTLTVGGGVTECLHSDNHAHTVIDLNKTGTRATVQQDKAIIDPNFKPNLIPGGFAAHCTNQYEQSYTYERNPEGRIRKISLRVWYNEYNKAWFAKWVTVGSNRKSGTSWKPGRHEFYDYNF